MLALQTVFIMIWARYATSYYLCQCKISGQTNELCCNLFSVCCSRDDFEGTTYRPNTFTFVRYLPQLSNNIPGSIRFPTDTWIFDENSTSEENASTKNINDEENKMGSDGPKSNSTLSHPNKCNCHNDSRQEFFEKLRAINILTIPKEILSKFLALGLHNDFNAYKAYKYLQQTMFYNKANDDQNNTNNDSKPVQDNIHYGIIFEN